LWPKISHEQLEYESKYTVCINRKSLSTILKILDSICKDAKDLSVAKFKEI